MHTWTADVAELFAAETSTNWLSELLDFRLVTPHALLGLRVPASLSGLGFLHPQHEAALHYLQAMLPTVEDLPVGDDGDDPVLLSIAEALHAFP